MRLKIERVNWGSLNITALQYFAAAVERGSLRRAADKFGVSTQAVSHAIAELERKLGRTLLVRERRGVYPTQFGIQLYRKSQTLRASLKELEAFVAEPDASQQADLRVLMAFPGFEGSDQICLSIAEKLSEKLGISASATLEAGEEGLAALRSKRADVLITLGKVNNNRVKCTLMGSVTPTICLSKDHPLAQREELTIQDLSAYPVSLRPSLDYFSKTPLRLYQDNGLESRVFETRNGDDLSSLFREHWGYAFVLPLPNLEFPFYLLDDLTIRPLAEADCVPASIYAVTPANRSTEHLEAIRELMFSGAGPVVESLRP